MSELFKVLASEEDTAERAQLLKMYNKELAELTARKVKLILEQEFTLGNLGKMHESMKIIIKKNGLAIKEKLAREHHNGWMFITINPKPDITFEFFFKLTQRLAKRKMWVTSTYAFEQRGSTDADAGKGFHVHMLCKRNLNYKPTHCKRNVQAGCKKLVASEKNNHLLNIQICGDDFAKDKLEYFTGIKKGTGKDLKQKIDKIWRKQIHIQEVYEHKKEH